MVTKTVDIQSARVSLEDVLAAVRKGAAIVFTEGSVPLARLVPLSRSKGGVFLDCMRVQLKPRMILITRFRMNSGWVKMREDFIRYARIYLVGQ